jgi:hypothetical protein
MNLKFTLNAHALGSANGLTKNILRRRQCISGSYHSQGINKAESRRQVISATDKYFAGRFSCMSEDNTKMYVHEPGWEIVDWIYVAHDRGKWPTILSRAMNFHMPNNDRNFLII